MKKILVSLIILFTACSLIFATTRAVWTRAVSVKGSKIETGNAEIQLSTKENPSETDWSSSEQNSNLVLSGLIPGGEAKSGYLFSLRNISTSDISFDLTSWIPSIQFSNGDPSDLSMLQLRFYDYENPSTGTDWISLSDLVIGENSLNSQLPKDTIKKFGLEARLIPDTNDEWQDQDINFELEVIGNQI